MKIQEKRNMFSKVFTFDFTKQSIFKASQLLRTVKVMKLNPVTLQFSSKGIEKDFLEDYFNRSLIHIRVALILGGFIFLLFGIWDAYIAPEIKTKLWIIRYVIIFPILLAIFIFSFSQYFKKYMQISISIGIISVGLGTGVITIIAPVIGISYGYIALILILMYTYTFIRLRFIYATIVCWSFIFVYEIISFWLMRISVSTLLSDALFLFSANFIGMFASYYMELYIRKDFLLSRNLEMERKKAENLLLNILPKPIAERLKQEESTIADSFPEVTVLFADIVDFIKFSSDVTPAKLVDSLNQIFSAFDKLAEKYNLEKIKTIGDAYMVVGGLPAPVPNHVEAIANMALDMQKEIANFNRENGKPFSIRIGINTGPVVAGVIGLKKFIYDLWGDTVNTASRMESHGVAGCIQVTKEVYERLKDKYVFEERGIIDVKGKGEMKTYILKWKRI